MTYTEYMNYESNRRRIISENKARRMRRIHQDPLEVPPKLNPPMWRVAYDKQGNFEGVIPDDDDPPEGMIVKLEPRKRDTV
jgi:hypothetical protein